jgi:hypothetical protein
MSSPFLYALPSAPRCDPTQPLKEPCRLVVAKSHELESNGLGRSLLIRVALPQFGDCEGFTSRLNELTTDLNKLAMYIDRNRQSYDSPDQRTSKILFDSENRQFDPNSLNSSFNKRLLTKGVFEHVNCATGLVTFRLPLAK